MALLLTLRIQHSAKLRVLEVVLSMGLMLPLVILVDALVGVLELLTETCIKVTQIVLQWNQFDKYLIG